MRFELTKVGGLIGAARQPIVVDTGALATADAGALIRLADEAKVFRLPPDLGTGDALPDEQGYSLVVTDGARRVEVDFGYPDASEPLRSLIREVKRLGSPRTA